MISVPYGHAIVWCNHESPCKSAVHISHKCSHEESFVNSVFIISAMKERSGLEGRRHEAEAVTAGDADGGKRDAADPATGVNHNF